MFSTLLDTSVNLVTFIIIPIKEKKPEEDIHIFNQKIATHFHFHFRKF